MTTKENITEFTQSSDEKGDLLIRWEKKWFEHGETVMSGTSLTTEDHGSYWNIVESTVIKTVKSDGKVHYDQLNGWEMGHYATRQGAKEVAELMIQKLAI